jgi:phosphoribosylglycinamide formyltransferase-1
MTARLAVLCSGRGTNLVAILDACARGALPAAVTAVISDRPGARALAIARARGIPAEALDGKAFASREAFDVALGARLDDLAPDLVVLAGFMRILTPGLVGRWLGRMVNIHPSLLPAYPGLGTHRRALADGARVHGASVHFVTPELDGGPVLMQAEVPVRPGDDEATLAARVLDAEHRLYPVALRRILAGQFAFRDGAAYSGSSRLEGPELMRNAEVA